MTQLRMLCLLLGLTFTTQNLAQNFNMSNAPITNCGGSFFDSGGPGGNYGNNQNLTTTICSDGSNGTHVRLDFSGLQLGDGDQLCFYDGTSVAAPLLACSEDFPPGQPFVVQATAVNPSGCLTVVFTSNAAGTSAGWDASISCVRSCQQILADIINTNPIIEPADTGWIDICPGQRITFFGQGVYPQNGFAYQQSDFTTEFEWNFGDGDIAYGPTASHIFTTAGGYYVQLFLRDTLGCRNTNLINQRIRVAPRPDFSAVAAFDNTICANDTIQLSAQVNTNNGDPNLFVAPDTLTFATGASRADSLALPDGTGIPYSTTLYLTEFSPGQTLTDINDLEGICVNMEHSWARDIEIKLTCPNGQTAILHNQPGNTGSQVFLGIPNDNDGFSPVPGIGYDYCWTPTATNTYWINYFNTVLGGSGTLPEGNYNSFQPLTNFIGCPLNGEWTLTITDLWPIDNGFIFSWGIDFVQELYPAIESFSPDLVSWQWNNNPTIVYYSQDSIAAVPVNAGNASYLFAVTDEFGCVWDTTVRVNVLPFLHPDCYSCEGDYEVLRDTSVCVGDPLQLNGGLVTGSVQTVRFEAAPDYAFGNSNHPHGTPYQSPIGINSINYNVLTNPAQQIASVCVDLNTDFDADIHLFLRSPDNKTLELSTNNGGSGDNYKVTCFTSTAATAINTGTAPFNGNYRPEGAWTALNNAVVNGDWKLLVSDGFGVNQLGRLNNWNITFNVPANITYTWSPGTDLSCNNCPNPTVTTTQNRQYILTATNAQNCTHRDTVQVEVTTEFAAPQNLLVTNMQGGVMSWSWSPIAGVTSYEVNLNNSGWFTVNGTSTTIPGLTTGSVVNIQVRAVGGSPTCPPGISNAQQAYFECTLNTNLDSTAPVTCPGGSNGAAIVNASGAQGTTVFYASFGSTLPYTNGNITGFPAGDHYILAVDNFGCRDTSFFTITEPDSIVATITATNVACFGENTGQLSAVVSGGTGTLTSVWQTCAGTNVGFGTVVGNLVAGCYRLTVSDQVGCSFTSTATIIQNPLLDFTGTQDSVSCFGLSDGSATVTPLGGSGSGYTFIWENSSTIATSTGLNAGFHACTITDGAGCEAVVQVEVLEPTPLVIDSLNAIPVSCFDQTNGLASVFPRGGTTPYTYQWTGTNQTSATIINVAGGLYNVTVLDASACSATGQILIEVPDSISVGINALADESCALACNGSVALTVVGGTMPYNIDWGIISAPSNALTTNDLCADNYAITVSDARNCTVEFKFDILAAPALDIKFNTNPPTCNSSSNGTISATVTGGAGPYDYLWSTGSTADNVTGASCNTYTVTVTDFNNCTQTATVTVSCPNVLNSGTLTGNAVSCFGGNNGTLTVAPTGGAGSYTFQWSDPLSQNGPTAINLTAGNYTVTVTDANGCTVTSTSTLPQPMPLSINTTNQPASCQGLGDGNATAIAAGGTGGYTYQWSNGLTTASIAVGAGSYTVTARDQNGCSIVALPVVVTQPTTPVTATTMLTRNACFGELNGAALASGTGSNGAPFTFEWSDGQTTAEASQLAPGAYTVTATDQLGCTNTASIVINEYAAINVNVATIPPTCYETANGQAAVNLVSGGAGGGLVSNYNLDWNGVPNAPMGDYFGSIPGDVPVTLVVTDQLGCSASFTYTLPRPAPLLPLVLKNDIQCFGQNNGQINVILPSPGTYSWDNGSTSGSLTDLQAGNYELTATDVKGCTGVLPVEITMPTELRVDFTITPIKCFDDENGAIEALVSGGTPGYLFEWDNGQDDRKIEQLPDGVYMLTITDDNGCTLTTEQEIQNPNRSSLITNKKDISCFGADNGQVSLEITSGIGPYRYAIKGQPWSGSPVFFGLEPGFYEIDILDGRNCIVTTAATIEEPAEVLVNLGDDLTITFGDTVTLNANIENAVWVVGFEWLSDARDSIGCINEPVCPQVAFVPEFSQNVTVVATDANGCVATDDVRISVEKPRNVDVPTGFTPNGDNNNDLLHVFGKSKQVKNINLFQIFDRWGERVYEDRNFEVNDLTRGWDGRFRGADCLPETYVWVIEVEYNDGFVQTLHGQVMLIR
jgi:gliding motility-associated-like protein